MTFTVVTVKNAPPSLKGDLTKWMQEIATGVYVGNFNIKVRDKLWLRIKESIGCGEATMTFPYRNEIGYNYYTINAQREVIDFDGIPLVLLPLNEEDKTERNKLGYSKAAKFRKAKKFSSQATKKYKTPYVVIDIETDGLEVGTNSIIEIGAIRVDQTEKKEFNYLIKRKVKLSTDIIGLTGITQKMLNEEGVPIEIALKELLEFIENRKIVGYNVNFDLNFINSELKKNNMPILKNKQYDLLKYVKKEKQFLNDYKLQTTLLSYGIDKKVPHRALSDSRLIYELSTKVNTFLKSIDKE